MNFPISASAQSSLEHLSTSPKRRMFQALAAILSLSAVGVVCAQPGAAAGGRRPDAAQMISRRIDHLISHINGTPEQKAKLTALAQAALNDLKPLREQYMAARKRGMELLAAPSIDRVALEKLRVEQMQVAESMSRRILSHMADAAEVLTPAQRVQLAEKMKSRGEHGSRANQRRGDHDGGSGGALGGMGGLGFWR